MRPELCNPLATIEHMCCVDSHTCPPESDPLSERLDEWLADPGQPLESYTPDLYSEEEYAWLVRAQAQLLSGSQWLLGETCGLPTGECETTVRASRCAGNGRDRWLPEVYGPVTNVVVEIWDADGDVDTPDRTMTLGTEFFMRDAPTVVPEDRVLRLYEGFSWPADSPSSPVAGAGTSRYVITHGKAVPLYVAHAVADWACARVDRCLPADRCEDYTAPDHTKSVGKVQLLTDLDYLKEGLTGVKSINRVLVDYSCAKRNFGFHDPAERNDFAHG